MERSCLTTRRGQIGSGREGPTSTRVEPSIHSTPATAEERATASPHQLSRSRGQLFFEVSFSVALLLTSPPPAPIPHRDLGSEGSDPSARIVVASALFAFWSLPSRPVMPPRDAFEASTALPLPNLASPQRTRGSSAASRPPLLKAHPQPEQSTRLKP